MQGGGFVLGVIGLKSLTVAKKSSVLNTWLGSESSSYELHRKRLLEAHILCSDQCSEHIYLISCGTRKFRIEWYNMLLPLSRLTRSYYQEKAFRGMAL